MRPGPIVTASLIGAVCGAAEASPRLLLLPDGTPVGYTTDVRPGSWQEDAAGRWQANLRASRDGGAVVFTVGERVDAAPVPGVRAIVVSELDLLTPSGAPLAVLYCPEVDLLGTAGTKQAVRAFLGGGVILEGQVTAIPDPVGWGDCPARRTAGGEAPSHWLRADPTARDRVSLVGTVWWDAEGRGCERWTFEPTPSGVRLQHTVRTRTPGGGRDALTRFHPIESVEGAWVMGSDGQELRWIREPKGGSASSPGQTWLGIGWPLVFVEAHAHALTWVVASGPVTAYHPADAQTWARSRAGCGAGTEAG